VDIHKHYVYVTEINDKGEKKNYRASLDAEGIDNLGSRLGPDTMVVMEATSNSFRLCDELAPYTNHIKVAHPCQTRGATSLHLRTDKVASEILARLLATGFIREVWVPDPALRALRNLVEYRSSLTHMKITTQSRIHALFQQEMLTPCTVGILCKKGRHFIEELQWKEEHHAILCASLLHTHDALRAQIEKIDRSLRAWSQNSPEAHILMTIPGVGPLIAAFLLSQIGSVERFPDPRKLCAYAGIVPRIYESGKTSRTGRITRAGRHVLRWALSLAVPNVIRRPGAFQEFHQKLSSRRPGRVVHVACARKLLTVIWHMLTYKKTFNDEDKELTVRKMNALNHSSPGTETGGTF
jgi:transposase